MTSSGSPFPPDLGTTCCSLSGSRPGNIVTDDRLATRSCGGDSMPHRFGIVSRLIATEGSVADIAFAAPRR